MTETLYQILVLPWNISFSFTPSPLITWNKEPNIELVQGGALKAPADQAVLLFKGDSAEVAESFAQDDPYVQNGLVKKWEVREWTTVVGEEASNPVRVEREIKDWKLNRFAMEDFLITDCRFSICNL